MSRQSWIFAKMIPRIKGVLDPPIFEDEEKTRIAGILGIILWSVVVVVATLMLIWLAKGQSDELGPYAFLANGVIVAVAIGLLFLIRSGRVKSAGLIFIIFLWANITFQAFTSDGVRGSAPIIYMTIMVLAGLLVGWKTSIAFAVLSTVSMWILAHAEVIGLITFQTSKPYEVALEATAMFVLAALFLTLTTIGLSIALRRARSSEKSLKESNRSLQNKLAELAQREEDLRESEERFRVLFEHAPDPFFFLKTDGALVGGNKAGQLFTGFKDGEMVGKKSRRSALFRLKIFPEPPGFCKKAKTVNPPARVNLTFTIRVAHRSTPRYPPIQSTLKVKRLYWGSPGTSPAASKINRRKSDWKPSSSRPKKWKPSGPWPAASPTTSTTSWGPSWGIPNLPSKKLKKRRLFISTCRMCCMRAIAPRTWLNKSLPSAARPKKSTPRFK